MENTKEKNSTLEIKLDNLLAKAKEVNYEPKKDVAVEEPKEKQKKCSGDCNCKCQDKN